MVWEPRQERSYNTDWLRNGTETGPSPRRPPTLCNPRANDKHVGAADERFDGQLGQSPVVVGGHRARLAFGSLACVRKAHYARPPGPHVASDVRGETHLHRVVRSFLAT